MSKNLIAFTTSELAPQKFREYDEYWWIISEFCFLHGLHSACFDHDALHAVRLCCQRTSVQFVKIRRCRRAMPYSVLNQSSDGLACFDASAVCRDHGDMMCILDPFSLKGAAGRKVWRSSRVPLLQRSIWFFMPLPLPFPFLEISRNIYKRKMCQWPQSFSYLLFLCKECAIGQAGAGTAEGWQWISNQEITEDLQPRSSAVDIKTRYSNGFVLQ